MKTLSDDLLVKYVIIGKTINSKIYSYLILIFIKIIFTVITSKLIYYFLLILKLKFDILNKDKK
jgi:hypothetical protein